VVYEGRRWVFVEGTVETQIDRSAVEGLLDAFYTSRFFGLEPEYRSEHHACVAASGEVTDCESMVTDLPSQLVTFQIPGYVKTVVDYWDAPIELRELEEAIDEAAGTDRWVHGPTPTP
jgi:hypothetical protein